VIDAIQRIYLPYTVIDVGWWSEQVIPSLPSGRTDLSRNFFNVIPGDGNVQVALTCKEDIGRYVAKIIADPRTINKKVFAFTDCLTLNQVYDLMDEISGESSVRKFVSRGLRKE
jgi:hypothetical protein